MRAKRLAAFGSEGDPTTISVNTNNTKRKYTNEPIGTIELLSDDDSDNDSDSDNDNDRKPSAKGNKMEMIELLDSEDDDDDKHIDRNTIVIDE